MYSTLTLNRPPNSLTGMMGLGALGVGDVSSQLIGGGISAGVGLASTVLGSWLADKRQAGLARTYSTTIVNQLEQLLHKNTEAYLAGPGSCADQAAALAAFDSAMQWLQGPQACGNLQLGVAGQNCINDRMPGGKWDWSAMYRDPIANDTRPVCNNAADAGTQAAVQNIFNKLSGSAAQTEAGMYSSTPGGTGASAGLLDQSLNVAGVNVPMSYLLLGGGVLVLVLMLK